MTYLLAFLVFFGGITAYGVIAHKKYTLIALYFIMVLLAVATFLVAVADGIVS